MAVWLGLVGGQSVTVELVVTCSKAVGPRWAQEAGGVRLTRTRSSNCQEKSVSMEQPIPRTWNSSQIW